MSSPYPHIKKGSFLIASPEMEPGFFSRSVILLCEHTPTGCFGLTINKPLNLEAPEQLLAEDELPAAANIQLRAGGPIQLDQMMLLHTSQGVKDTLEICDGVYLGGDMEFLQQAIAETTTPNLILCFGYSGWGPNVLEKELAKGNWILKEASSKSIFSIPAEKLWQTLLIEMGGRYAMLAMIPEDLSMN